MPRDEQEDAVTGAVRYSSTEFFGCIEFDYETFLVELRERGFTVTKLEDTP